VEQLEERTLLSGTPQLLADINPGTGPSNASHLAVIGSTTYFAANDGTHGSELWKTDGTAAGTSMVADIHPGSGNSYPAYFTNVNGKLYFRAFDGTHGMELWSSDGTAAGTAMVADITPGGPGSYPISLTNVNGELYFSAIDGTHGWELWKSDGTVAGTTMVKDICPPTSRTYYYTGDYGTSTRSVVIDGSNPFNLTNVNGTLYFSASDGTHGTELWTSDGTAAGTTMVKDIHTGSTTFTTYTRGNYGSEYETWTLPNSSYAASFTNFNGKLYFTANDGTNGDELWSSDGTAAGTAMFADMNPGSVSSNPGSLTNVSGTLYFAADDGTHGYELWKSSGAAAGTSLVADINPGSASSGAWNLTNVNGELFFTANDGTHGDELWKSNGTVAGTTLVKDICPPTTRTYSYWGDYGQYTRNIVIDSSIPFSLTNINGKLFFSANDGTNGTELWTSDGTAAGTIMVKDIHTGSNSYQFSSLGYFGGIETKAWTAPSSSNPGNFTNLNGTLLFTADDGTHGNELWKVPYGPSLAVSADSNTPTAGVSDTFTITALNADGTVNTSFNDPVAITSSDTKAILPTSVTFTNGVGQFSATFKTAGTQSITATDSQTPSDNGTEGDIVVQAAEAKSITVTGFPSPATIGIAGSFTITAFDAYGNVATGYAGTVTFSSSDPKAVLPGDATFSNGSGQFSATLKTLGTNLSITATDKNKPTLTASQTGIKVIPFASITGPSAGALKQTLTYTLGAGADPAGTVFTVSWGDGNSDQTTGTTIAHTYSTSASYTISVTATVAGLNSNPATQAVNILPVSVTIQTDPAITSKQMLVIDGTANSDNIVLGSGASNGVTLSFNGTALGNILPTNSNPFALVLVFGKGGNDTLDARSLSVSSVLVGGSGSDTLFGGSGRNLIIGGAGADTLYAGSAGDILIGGTTSYDSNNASDQKALAYLMAEWASTASYSTRVKQLNGKAGSSGLNGSYFLNSNTVFDDNTKDVLNGYSLAVGDSLDWFFAHYARKNSDQVNNQVSGEVATSI
jgi:ELWxxDGT repeat protein